MEAYNNLLETYQDLNGSHIDELHAEPSPLEFMRYVSRNRPFVVRSGAKNWPAVQNWNVAYLKACMQNRKVNIAVTPYGFV
jgi:peptidyl-lysine (3S)-dioxygenase / protease